MRHITAEQFLQQPLEVQKVFLEWCQPQINGLYIDLADETQIECLSHIGTDGLYHSHRDNISIVTDIIPVLELHQLIEFIEDKTGGKIDMTIVYDNTYDIRIYIKNSFGIYNSLVKEFLNINSKTLLEAMWKVACEIAQEVNDIEVTNVHSEKE